MAGLERGAMAAADPRRRRSSSPAAPAPRAPLVVANVAGTLLAYRDRCAGCDAPLTEGELLGGTLTCARVRRRFDLPRAGRCLDDDGLQLEPVPLLRNGGPVRVALGR